MERIAVEAAPAVRVVRTLHGYSPWPIERIGDEVHRGAPMASIPGDFVFVESRPGGDEIVASSAVSAIPYYYSISSGGGVFHGKTAFNVVEAAGFPWKWNHRAVACLGLLGHTVGEDTLHSEVRRFPADSVLRIQGGRASFTRGDFWRTLFSGPPESPDRGAGDAIEAFQKVLREMPMPAPFLSLSAGFDSRLLLAGMLREGIKPVCITMGGSGSTDIVVAGAIARRFRLEHRIVELRAEDYLSHASEIISLTGGVKTAAHWHTYLYVRRAGIPAGSYHYAGSNGEFARSYYFDKGALARLADASPGSLLRLFFALKFLQRSDSRRLKRAFLPEWEAGRPMRDSEITKFLAESVGSAPGFLDALDLFYSTQRVRHFIGNGLALYNAVVPTLSPFLDSRWIRSVAAMPRRWKLGSRYHREAIACLFPELLDFPMASAGLEMSGRKLDRKPPFLSWMRRPAPVGYSPFPEIAGDSGLRETLRDSELLDRFADRASRARLLETGGSRAVDVLLTLHLVASEIRKRRID
ncbi:MAG: hypothetical protein ACRD16_00375 [Thermoanaerobaculia bacterium]